MKTAILKFLRDEEGLTIVEYAVAGALITVAVIVAFRTLGTNVASSIAGLASATNNPAP